MEGCLACDLIAGRVPLPGGRIAATQHWVVEPCVGPFPAGTLIVKPFRHCEHVWDLTADEAGELGPLLARATDAIRQVLAPDQVYVCLWSHAGWRPGHIHFVLQPAWNAQQATHEKPGPFLQVDLFATDCRPGEGELVACADHLRTAMGTVPSPVG